MTAYSGDVVFCGEDINYTHKCKSPKTKYPYLHDRGYDKLGYSRELLIKVEGLLRKRALAKREKEISNQEASIDLAREEGNGCFDYSDEEGHELEDFDCNIIYADMLLQNARRGIFTYTDQEAKEILDDAFIVGTARRTCQIARNPRKVKKMLIHYGGRMVKQTVPLTKVEAQRLDQERHAYDYRLRRQWRSLQKAEEVPGYLTGKEKARAIELAIWQASKGYAIRPREQCLPGESSADAKRRRLLKMIKGVPEKFRKLYGLKKNWIHTLQQTLTQRLLPVGEFRYGENDERSESYYSQGNQSQEDYEDSTSEESEEHMPPAPTMAPTSADYRNANLPQRRRVTYHEDNYYDQYANDGRGGYNYTPTTGRYTVGGSSSSGANP